MLRPFSPEPQHQSHHHLDDARRVPDLVVVTVAKLGRRVIHAHGHGANVHSGAYRADQDLGLEVEAPAYRLERERRADRVDALAALRVAEVSSGGDPYPDVGELVTGAVDGRDLRLDPAC